jgi:hypothetical protein
MDVDSVARYPDVAIKGGVLSNGFGIQFDKNSLDIMDRIIGFHLSQMESVISPVAQTSGKESAASMSSAAWGSQLYSAIQRNEALSVSPQTSSIENLLKLIETATNELNLQQAISDYYGSDATPADKVLAVAGGLGAVYNLMPIGGAAAKEFGYAYGAAVASSALLNNLTMELTDAAFIMSGWYFHWDSSAINAALGDITKRGDDSKVRWWDAEQNLVYLATDTGVLGEEFKTVLNMTGVKAALSSADLLLAVDECTASPCYSDLVKSTNQVGSEIAAMFGSSAKGIAVASGTAQIPNPFGLLADQSEIQLLSNAIAFDSLADENGTYLMFVPLGADPFQYAAANLQVIDPITQTGLKTINSQIVDLSKLTASDLFPIAQIRVQVDCTNALVTCLEPCVALANAGYQNHALICEGACLDANKVCNAL